jgi:foldase protein PrsA
MHTSANRVLTAAVTAIAIVALAGCGDPGNDSVIVVRVGTSTITSSVVAEQMAALAPEGIVPDPPRYTRCIAHAEKLTPQPIRPELKEECHQQYQLLKRQALDNLITTAWLIGEAQHHGLTASQQEIQKQLEAEKQTLNLEHSTTADIERALKAKLAATKLQHALIATELRVTPAQVVSYYHAHIQRFERQERRYFDIDERFTSKPAATKAMTDGDLRDLAKIAYHESLQRSNLIHPIPARKAITRAVFAAKPGILTGPVLLYGKWVVFRVTQTTPTTREPLSQARLTIEQELTDHQRRRTLARFIRAWRRRWTAKTSCRPGYIVQKCSNYHGTRTPEDAYSFR